VIFYEDDVIIVGVTYT